MPWAWLQPCIRCDGKGKYEVPVSDQFKFVVFCGYCGGIGSTMHTRGVDEMLEIRQNKP